MGINTQFSTDHSRIYEDFVRDLRYDEGYPSIRYPEDYRGQEEIKLCCSQHEGIVTEKERRELTQAWVAFLCENTLPLKEVQVCTKLNQSVFDALCTQSSIESLRIKWFTGNDVSEIVKLNHLKKLFIESGSSIEDISPICRLSELEVLILGNTVKVNDYSPISALGSLKVLGICAYQTHYDKKIKVKSTEFIDSMSSLEYVDIQDVVTES